MAQSVDPILLNSTGQDIVTALNAIANKTVDSALSLTSVNPVQNKVITGEINGIKEKIPNDASSSNKMATANDITGIQNAVEANTKLIKDTVGWSGKNLCEGSIASTSINDSGLIISTADFKMNYGKVKANKKYIITSDEAAGLVCGFFTSIPVLGATSYNGTRLIQANKTFTAPIDGYIAFRSTSSYDVAMLRDADILDDTYEPYLGSTAFPRSEQIVLGAKNLCPMPYQNGYTMTASGVTFTVNEDGSYNTNGTAGDTAFLVLHNGINNILTKGQKYILSSGQTSNGGIQIYYKENADDNWIQLARAVESEIEFTTPNNANFILIRGYIGYGNTVSNKVYYPMIRLATDLDDTYAPYAMTNKELMDNKIDNTLIVTVSSNITGTKNVIANAISQIASRLKKNGQVIVGQINYENSTQYIFKVLRMYDGGYRFIINTSDRIYTGNYVSTSDTLELYQYNGTVVS